MLRFLPFVFALSFGLMASFVPGQSAKAMPTLIVNNDQLLGADNLDLGSLGVFDVRFLDGTCPGLFSGCDNASEDFTFQTEDAAEIAAQALLDFVFIDGFAGDFDSNPNLTNGCESLNTCQISIPFDTLDGLGAIDDVRAQNSSLEAQDTPLPLGVFTTTDTTLFSGLAFARFTPSQTTTTVPEPSALFLIGAGLFGVAAARRRRRSRR